MLLTNSTFEFIEQIDQQNDIPSLVGAFEDLIGKFGMRCFLMGDPSRPDQVRDNRVLASTWPEEWLRHWLAQDYMRTDPVLHQLLSRNEPVRWSEATANDELGARILDEASEFKMVDGFALPVYSRDGFVVGITIGTDHYELGKQEEACLHLASIYFHAKLEKLRALNTPQKRGPRLTPRERECLSWVAAGKTDWEISQILNIAEQTAHEYVQNALTKLNATTRAQAVAVAIFTKQILC
ncbi:MAG TPA: LuxR family transcriptional regulator [Rhizomicrobium sp.]|nr:LuxR family transcriptional regulator [Rhizomicrobium sp.]